jgi:hypothetical protein
MTSADLRHLLQDLAADGTERVELDERQLIPRIRARRRRRTAVTGVLGLAAAGMVAAGTYAALPGDGIAPAAPVPTVAAGTPGTITPSPGQLTCGSTPSTAGPSTDSPLQLSLTQKVITSKPGSRTAPIGIHLTNTGREAIAVNTAPNPGLVLVKDGVVVAEALRSRGRSGPRTVLPGQTATFAAEVDVRQCAAGSSAPVLPTGWYELYAVLDFTTGKPAAKGGWEQLVEGPMTIRLD